MYASRYLGRSQQARPKGHPIHILVDISSGREVLRIAANILAVRVLVDTNVVDLHDGWEREVLQVDVAEVSGHAKVGNQVHRLLRNRSRSDFDCRIGRHTRLIELPRQLAVCDPTNVLKSEFSRLRYSSEIRRGRTAPSNPG